MKITVNGGPQSVEPTDTIPFRQWIGAWLQLSARNPRRTPVGQIKMIETEQTGMSGGYPTYRVKPGKNGHVWNPVRKGLRLTWEYCGPSFTGGCRCPR